MEVSRQREMRENYDAFSRETDLSAWRLYAFGHTEATGYLLGIVEESGHCIEGILDNNPAKQGTLFKNIPIVAPCEFCQRLTEKTIVFITSRAYAAMLLQLNELGFRGRVVKLVEYNTFAEYNLTPDAIYRKMKREQQGSIALTRLHEEAGGCFIIICPFKAVGDVYYAMKYMTGFCKRQNLGSVAVAVVGDSCADVVKLFYDVPIFVLEQREMDELVQAVLYRQPGNVFIVHHDRPYTSYLIRLLRKQLIPFEIIYRVGIYGLSGGNIGKRARFWQNQVCEVMPQGKSVVLIPYAKSVVNLPVERWENIARVMKEKGYAVFSSVQDDEVPIEGTISLRDIPLRAMKSMMEQAGCFISIRNGLCDILQEAKCRKILLYPDACYSDTPWQVVQFFRLSGCDNVIFKNDGSWEIYDGGRNRPFDFAEDVDL